MPSYPNKEVTKNLKKNRSFARPEQIIGIAVYNRSLNVLVYVFIF